MRRTIIFTAVAVSLAAGIAVSQQPPGSDGQQPPAGGGGQPGSPPRADLALPLGLPGSEQGPAIVALPPGQTATYFPIQTPTPYVSRLAAFEADPEVAELNRLDQQLEHDSRTLVNQLAESPEKDDQAGQELKDKLSDVLEKQFDAQQKIREIEVTRIEERVKKLRELINKRNAARKTIVDRRRQQLIDDAEGFGWSSAGGAGTATPNAAFDPYGAPPYGAPQPARYSLPLWNRSNKPRPGPTRSSMTRPIDPGGPVPGIEPPAARQE